MTVGGYVAIALGGAAGAVCRAMIGAALPSDFPWATLMVNLGGSALLGFLVGLEAAFPGGIPPAVRGALGVGFCGAFTTFSTFSQQTLALAEQGRWGTSLANAGLNLGGCLIATGLGLWMAARLRLS